MKASFLRFGLRFALFSLALLLGQTGRAAVAFTLTPSAVSNTYTGTITLQVTGLASGGSVVVQKYLDANANGIIDAGDLLVQQFNLTDGQVGMVIGGVTNFNVPGDTDNVAGQITAKLILQLGFSQLITGNYLFKLSSLTGVFQPITNSFAVPNIPYAQKLTGTVVSNGVAVPYAAVLLLSATSGNPIGGAVANSSGIYTIPAPQGTYELLAFKSNFVANAAATLVLSNGATLNTNLTLIPTTQTISGKFVDSTNSSLGLPGLFVLAQNKTQGLLGIGYTGTNGSFSLGVNSNQWKIEADSAGVALLGYVAPNSSTNVSATNGSVSGVTINFTKGTALIYGTVTDSFGKPLAGMVDLYAQDENNNGNNQYKSEGYANTNGNYVAAVVGGLGGSDTWQVTVDNSSSFPNYDFSQPQFDQDGGTNISAGQAVLANFTALLATNYISGNVKFDGTNLVGLAVNANTQDANSYQAQAITDSNGNYSLAVGNNGNWNVSVNCQGNNNSLQSILGSASYECPCGGATINISNNNSTGNNIVVTTGGTGEIYGYLTNSSGAGISGVSVYLNNNCSGNNYSTSTGGDGAYSFTGIPYGNYNVNVDCGGLSSQGYNCVNNPNVTLSSATLEQNFTAQSSGGGAATLYGHVQDTGGNNVAGVTVSATNFAGVNYTTTTDQNGYYGFIANNGAWGVTVSCSGLNSLGYACVSEESATIYMDSVELDFTVEPGGSSTPLEITTASVPAALAGTVYTQQLSASGGQAPYRWTLDPASLLLPQGVLLNTNGIVSGALTSADVGTNYFIADVTDHLGNTANQFLSLSIYPALTIASNALPNGTVGTPYSAPFLVSGGNGLYGYNTTGTFPPGLNVNFGTTTGSNELFSISGTPTNNGTFQFTFIAQDFLYNTAGDYVYVQTPTNFSITIVSSSLQITTPASLTGANAGVPYSNQLEASGGAAPYVWTIATGSQQPPAVLTLSTNGLLSGEVAASGTNSFIVRLTDHNSLTTTRTFTLITGPNPSPTLGSAVKSTGSQFQFLLTGPANQNYTVQVSTNLSSTNWAALFITNSATTNSILITDPNATGNARFYRILIGP